MPSARRARSAKPTWSKWACVSTTASTSSERRPSWESASWNERHEVGTPASTIVSRPPSSTRYQFVFASSMRWTPGATSRSSMASEGPPSGASLTGRGRGEPERHAGQLLGAPPQVPRGVGVLGGAAAAHERRVPALLLEAVRADVAPAGDVLGGGVERRQGPHL